MALARWALLVAPASLASLASLVIACGHGSSPSPSPSSSAPSSAPSAQRSPPSGPASPVQPGAASLAPSNPLGLGPARVTLDKGRRVFTFTEPMMAAARPGATLVLHAATVASSEGDDLIIEGRGAPSYKVHPGYVIPVPDAPPLRPGDAVLTEHNAVMRHAVVTRLVKDRVVVRLTDLGSRSGEIFLQGGSGAPLAADKPSKAARFARQVEGLARGNYAALRQGDEWQHVLLISASGEGEARRWFALGYGGAALIVSEADLKPIPVKWSPKVGSAVWAEHAGKMRRATVVSADEPGLFTVKYERAGRPATVGWGLLMAPLTG